MSGPGPEAVSTPVSVLTARLLADDAVRAVPAGPRLPQATVALDPEAGVWGQHGQGRLMRLPVAVGHLFVLAPHQTPACSRNTWTRSFKPEGSFSALALSASAPSFRLLNMPKFNEHFRHLNLKMICPTS